MIFAQHDSTILEWRGLVVRLDPPPRYFYVYLIHFHQKFHHAGHYLGSTGCLDGRLARHRAGNGARLMQVISEAGITWELARLWRCDSWEESRDLERRLKRWSGSGQFCPMCRNEPLDDLTFMRAGHQRLTWRMKQARPRRPMPRERNQPWQRD